MTENNGEFRENNEYQEERLGVCKCCGSLIVEEGYNYDLCESCRDKLSKRPIPKKFLLMAIGIIVILIISLMKFPSYLNEGLNFKKATKAIKEGNYVTAMNYYEELVDNGFDSYENKIELAELYYYNDYISDAYDIYESLAGISMDKVLVNKAEKIMNKIEKYYIYGDELYYELEKLEDDTDDSLLELIKPYVENYPSEVCGTSTLIDIYMDKNMFEEAKVLAERIVSENQDYYYGKYQLASIYIELGEYENCSSIISEMLDFNKESIYAYISQSKIELKKGNNKEGLNIAEEAFNLDPYNIEVLMNLALAYHCNDMIEERDSIYDYCVENELVVESERNYYDSIFLGNYNWQNKNEGADI